MSRLIRTHWGATLWLVALLSTPGIWFAVNMEGGVTGNGEGGGASAPSQDVAAEQIDGAEYSQLMQLREAVGLMPRDMAAMACTEKQVEEILTQILAWHKTNREAIDAAELGVIRAKSDLRDVYEKMSVGPRDEGVIATVPMAERALATAESQNEAVYASAVSAVETKLGADQARLWQTVRENMSRKLPDSLRYVDSVTDQQAELFSSGRAKATEVLSGLQLASLGTSREKINEGMEALVAAERKVLVVKPEGEGAEAQPVDPSR